MKRYRSYALAFLISAGLGLALASAAPVKAQATDSTDSSTTPAKKTTKSKKKSTDASSTDSSDASSWKIFHVEIEEGEI